LACFFSFIFPPNNNLSTPRPGAETIRWERRRPSCSQVMRPGHVMAGLCLVDNYSTHCSFLTIATNLRQMAIYVIV
jgi:hypothetical protein